MNKVLKFVVLPLTVIVVLAAAAVAYVAATFDPNAYKPQIVQAVKDKTQRNLKLEGDITLAIFPTIGARLGKVSLSERGNDREFAGVDDVRVALKLMPLLSKQVVIDTIEVKNLRAHLVRFKDGRTNIDDLTGGKAAPAGKGAEPAQGAAPHVEIDIAHINIENANVTYADEAAGERYALSKLNLTTGRIAEHVPVAVKLAFFVQSDKPKLGLDTNLRTTLTFELEPQHFVLKDLDFSAKGAAAGFKDLAASAKGNIDARPASKEILLSKLVVAASGKQESGELNFKFDAPKLTVTKDQVSGEPVGLDAKLSDAKQKLAAKFAIAGISGTAQAFKTGEINGNLDLQREGATTKATLAGSLAGNIETQRFELPKFTVKLNVNDPKLPKNPIDATITGAARVDLAKQNASMEFATKLDDSNINGKAGLTRFSPPAINFDVAIDQLDADRYLAKDKGGKPAPAGPSAKGGEQAIDLSALKGVNLNGSIRIGTLKVANIKSSQVRVEMKINNGRLDVNPVTANLYQGSLAGTLSAQAAAPPVFAVKQTLTGVNVGPLLKDAANVDVLEGRGNVTVDVNGQGNTVSAIKKALGGKAAFRLTDGAVKGINIGATIRGAKAKLGALRGEQTQAANAADKTDFSELSGTFSIKNGVAHNSDLSGKSPLLRLGGEGDIDIGNETLNYLLKATVVATAAGQGGKELSELKGVTVPVRLTGSFGAPQYKVDFSGMVSEIAKAKVEEKKEEIKAKIQEQVQDRIKGLFGR